jgi:hypothetical protein
MNAQGTDASAMQSVQDAESVALPSCEEDVPVAQERHELMVAALRFGCEHVEEWLNETPVKMHLWFPQEEQGLHFREWVAATPWLQIEDAVGPQQDPCHVWMIVHPERGSMAEAPERLPELESADPMPPLDEVPAFPIARPVPDEPPPAPPVVQHPEPARPVTQAPARQNAGPASQQRVLPVAPSPAVSRAVRTPVVAAESNADAPEPVQTPQAVTSPDPAPSVQTHVGRPGTGNATPPSNRSAKPRRPGRGRTMLLVAGFMAMALCGFCNLCMSLTALGHMQNMAASMPVAGPTIVGFNSNWGATTTASKQPVAKAISTEAPVPAEMPTAVPDPRHHVGTATKLTWDGPDSVNGSVVIDGVELRIGRKTWNDLSGNSKIPVGTYEYHLYDGTCVVQCKYGWIHRLK